MTERDAHIIRAARAMFARYGFAKTTMGDIAAEAGVARQTLYNAFPGKNEILRAVVRLTGEETIEAVQAAWAEAKSLDEKLGHFVELAPVAWFNAIRAAPDWAELLDGLHQAASEEMSSLDAQWHSVLLEMLQAEGASSHVADQSLEDIVAFFYTCSIHAKHGAADEAGLRRILSTIQAATLALLTRRA